MNPREQQREFQAREEHAQALNRRRERMAQMQKRQRKMRLACVLAVCLVLAGTGAAFAAASANNSPAPAPENAESSQAENSAEKAPDSGKNADAGTSTASAGNAQAQQAPVAAPADERSKQMALDPANNSNWRLQTDGQKKVYLTFDDGPSENTERILDILAKSDVKATFFVTGHSPDKFGLIKREWDAGHSVGMHSYSHNYAEIYTSTAAYKADLEKIGGVIKEQIGFVPFLFRFPGGSSNAVSAKYCQGIMTALTGELVAEGYQYYDWNISSGDAGGDDVPASEIVANSCQEGWTNIMLLMHDTDAKNTTVEALGHIIKFYKERGYQFCAIDRSSFAVHHKVGT